MNKALYILTAYVVLLGGSYYAYHLILPIRVSAHIIALIVLLAYLYRAGIPNHPLTLGAVVSLAALLLAIPGSLDPRMALENGWTWFINSLLLLALIQLCRSGYAPTLFQAHYLIGGLVALLALAEFLITLRRPLGLFGSISITGAYLAALVVPVAHAYRVSEGRPRLACRVLLILLIVAVGVGDNRGAYLSAGVGVLVYITLMWRAPLIRKAALWAMLGAGLLAVLIVLTDKRGHAAGDPLRLDLWMAGLKMLTTYPRGVGPGLFAQGYRLFGSMGFNQFADAHNHYITLGAELGLAGLAAGALVLILFVYCARRFSLLPSQKAALAALVGIGAHMVGDSFPVTGFVFLVALYVAYITYPVEITFSPAARKLITGAALLILAGWTYQMLRYDLAQVHYERALKSGAVSEAMAASDLDPHLNLYSLELARLHDPQFIPAREDLGLYGLTMYGRVFK